jgi:hypothetical protein
MAGIRLLASSLILSSLASWVVADDVRTFDEDGIKYQETTQVVQRPITETRYEPREYTSYREKYTTDMQDVQRTYQVSVTRQEWVPGYQRTWNIFAPPVLSYRLLPVTRLETRTESVRIPVTKREMVPEKLVRQEPVTNTRMAQEKHIHRVAVGTVQDPNSPLVANRNDAAGGTKVNDDQPRNTGAVDWEPRRP